MRVQYKTAAVLLQLPFMSAGVIKQVHELLLLLRLRLHLLFCLRHMLHYLHYLASEPPYDFLHLGWSIQMI